MAGECKRDNFTTGTPDTAYLLPRADIWAFVHAEYLNEMLRSSRDMHSLRCRHLAITTRSHRQIRAPSVYNAA